MDVSSLPRHPKRSAPIDLKTLGLVVLLVVSLVLLGYVLELALVAPTP